MQYIIVQRSALSSSYNGLKLYATGQISQVRNHTKMYPWRQSRNNPESYLDTRKTPYTDKHNINEFRPSKFQRKPWMKVVYKDKDTRFNQYAWHEAYTSDPLEAKETAASRLQGFVNSLKDRGAARESKAYEPPNNVREKVLIIFNNLQRVSNQEKDTSQSQIVLSDSNDEAILSTDLNQSKKFKSAIIMRCIESFNHDLSTASLNDMNTVADLVEYYSTPVRGITPYSALVRSADSLPANLAIISEAIRFDKETDTFFGGKTALPGNVSEVPGLRAKQKYQTLNQDEFQWPDI